MVEVLGYIGTGLIVLSLTMKSIVRLRVVNLAGAVLYVIYGALIGSLPVAVLNFLTSSINAVHLFKHKRRKETFETLQAKSIDEPMMYKFLEFYRDDIVSYFGVPDLSRSKDYLILYILRDMNLAGIFIGEKIKIDKKIKVQILIDYVTPAYRDLKNSKYLFHEKKEWFRKNHITRFECLTSSKDHAKYLRKIGFNEEQNGAYSFEI